MRRSRRSARARGSASSSGLAASCAVYSGRPRLRGWIRRARSSAPRCPEQAQLLDRLGRGERWHVDGSDPGRPASAGEPVRVHVRHVGVVQPPCRHDRWSRRTADDAREQVEGAPVGPVTVLEVHRERTHAVQGAQGADHRREEPLEAPEVVGRRSSRAVVELGQQPASEVATKGGRPPGRPPSTDPVVLEHRPEGIGHRHEGHLAGEVQAAADGDEDVRRGRGRTHEGRLADACLARDQQQPGARREVVSYDPQLGDAARDPGGTALGAGSPDGAEAASHSSRACGDVAAHRLDQQLDRPPAGESWRRQRLRDGGVRDPGLLGEPPQAGPARSVVQVVEHVDELPVGTGRHLGSR